MSMHTVASKVDADTFERLAWLAYTGRTTVSAVLSGYISRGLAAEDFTGYTPRPSDEDPARPAIKPEAWQSPGWDG